MAIKKKSLIDGATTRNPEAEGASTKAGRNPAGPTTPANAKKLAVAKLATAKLSTAKLTTLRRLS
jgi:hypothetical protein